MRSNVGGGVGLDDKKLYSPTNTDSTDEPTPMGLFKQGKGFKFNEEMMIDEELLKEGIGFDNNSGEAI